MVGQQRIMPSYREHLHHHTPSSFHYVARRSPGRCIPSFKMVTLQPLFTFTKCILSSLTFFSQVSNATRSKWIYFPRIKTLYTSHLVSASYRQHRLVVTLPTSGDLSLVNTCFKAISLLREASDDRDITRYPF
jgi:hypothetical protein